VNIEHKIDQCPFQRRTRPYLKGKSAPGDLCRAGEIKDVELLPQLPMGKGGKFKVPDLSPVLDNRVIVGVQTHGNRFVGDIWDNQQETIQFIYHLEKFSLKFFDSRGNSLHV
jgi:hypothetical protein